MPAVFCAVFTYGEIPGVVSMVQIKRVVAVSAVLTVVHGFVQP